MEILGFTAQVAIQVFILFLLIFTGLILFKTKLIDSKGVTYLVNILFYAVTPVLIINSFGQVKFSKESAASLAIVFACSVLAHSIGIIIGVIIFRNKGDKTALLRTSVIFSNCGFMSLPLAEALFKSQGVFLVSAYVAVNNLIIWTVGVKMFSGGKMSLKKAFLNPGVIGILLGLPIFLFGIEIPAPIGAAFTHISNLNTPLAMIIVGCYLAEASLRPQKGDVLMWVTFLFRLIIVPVVSLLLFLALRVGGTTLSCVMIPVSAPTAASVMMFTAKYGGDTRLASRIVPISTLLSIITMPLILTLTELSK
ncbi:MAG TPA: AEC family transporter [Clostridiales bacterium]|nr:AEC family transporter [Clostridiales bacterium]